jgi:hypothetical protein
MTTPALDEVVARIKAQTAKDAEEDRAAGVEEGRQWAMTECTAREFRRLWKNEMRLQAVETLDATEAAEFFVKICCGEDADPIEFWSAGRGEEWGTEVTPEFVRGFGLGVLGVWQEIRSKI